MYDMYKYDQVDFDVRALKWLQNDSVGWKVLKHSKTKVIVYIWMILDHSSTF